MVSHRLQEFANRRKQIAVIELFGQLDPDGGYDYKKARLSRFKKLGGGKR